MEKANYDTLEALPWDNVALDKTAEESQRSRIDRHNMIERWETTLNLMNRRDKDIDVLYNQLQILKIEIHKKEAVIEEKKLFSNNEIENNKQLEEKIQRSERVVTKFRHEYQAAENLIFQFYDEINRCRYHTQMDHLSKIDGDIQAYKYISTVLF